MNLNNRIITRRRFLPSLLTFTVLALTGCSDESTKISAPEPVQTVKLATASDVPNYSEFDFPAEVSAVKTIDVSFEVTGRLAETNLRTGSIVKKGELLAKIDDTQFRQRLQEATTRLEQAKRDLSRTQQTFDKGIASQSELDSAKTAYELAKIAHDRAAQDLSYTSLKAPFDAQISQRLVENKSFVRAGDIIAKLQDVSRFYFNINVPERLLTGHQQGADIQAEASIISAPQKKYQLEYVEHATQPDPITQTYKVVFAAETTDPSLTPGARAKVHLKLGYQRYGEGLLVPITALVGNETNGFSVWKYNEKNQQVSLHQVNVLFVKDQHALINGNLKLGDKVVAAGAAKMREGLKVRPYRAEQR